MILVKYDPWGRMGNRMFQYAFGKILADIKGESFLAEALPNFVNTKLAIMPVVQPNGPKQISLKLTFGNNYADIEQLKKANCDIVVDSYLQNYKYYEDYKSMLCNLFTLPNNQQKPDDNELVVHIRETDYKILKANINKEYYYNNISKLNYDKVTIVTDDNQSETILYLKNKGFNILSDKPITEFNTYNNDNIMRDFVYMKDANHLFIAQSSFSWWTAFLGEHTKVYAPVTNIGMWKSNPDKDDVNLYMDHFIRIKE